METFLSSENFFWIAISPPKKFSVSRKSLTTKTITSILLIAFEGVHLHLTKIVQFSCNCNRKAHSTTKSDIYHYSINDTAHVSKGNHFSALSFNELHTHLQASELSEGHALRLKLFFLFSFTFFSSFIANFHFATHTHLSKGSCRLESFLSVACNQDSREWLM